jgi:hypothetical protein
MLRRATTTLLALALVCTAGWTAAFAHPPANTGVKEGAEPTPTDSRPDNKKAAHSGEKLKADMNRLVADARAGKVGTHVNPRQQPPPSNNLSKKTKIAIGVVVAAVVITAIVVATKANNGPGGNIRIF